tara:strand:- start:32 stop:265 length:234 start_codon:yes stop_codon:yes gene_type:complete
MIHSEIWLPNADFKYVRIPGLEGYILASSATESEIRVQNRPARIIEKITDQPFNSSNMPDNMVKEIVAKANPAPTDI